LSTTPVFLGINMSALVGPCLWQDREIDFAALPARREPAHALADRPRQRRM
jgi:hypothetical protein